MTDERTPEAIEDDPIQEAESTDMSHTDETGTSVDLNRVRDLVLAAHPDVVPEMIGGETFDELVGSVEPAREAYQRIASQTKQGQSAPRVASQPGQRSTSIADLESLSPLGKISEGLRRSQ